MNENEKAQWREHGTFRVRFEYPGDIGEYSSGTMSLLSEAEEYRDAMAGNGASAWIERADWIKEDEWVGGR